VSNWRVRKLLVVAGPLVVALALLVAWIPEFEVRPEPAYTRSEGVWELATALAARRVPVGVIASERAWEPSFPLVRPDPAASLAAVLIEFNAKHPLMVAAQVGGVVHLRNRNAPAWLRKALTEERYLAAPVKMSAMNVMFYTAAGLLRGAEITGIVGSGPMPGPGCPATQEVLIPAGRTTVAAIGDEVTRQSPGAGWLIVFDESLEDSVQVGILCSEGAWQISLR
jgi:hypothetical protein